MSKLIDLSVLSMTVLVAIHNAIADKPATGKTFSTRAKAVDRIEAIAKQKGIDIAERFDADGNPIVKKKPAKPVKGAKPEPKAKGPVVREVAEELLLRVVGTDGDGRKMGMKYEDVLKAIKEQFPDGNTTVACLRWYAVHMRERGVRVPNRPRSLPPKAEG